ncbi:MAG: DUF4440 domain-containing protein [Gemmatimonadota bacterium]
MMRPDRLIPVLLCAVLAGCGAVQSDEPNEPGALADTLTTLIAEAYDFTQPGVPERMSSLYANSDRVVSASGGTVTLSMDSVRVGIGDFWQMAGQNMRNARWIWHEVHVERLAPDAAVLTGTWSIPHIAPAGNDHVIEGAWTAVFSRRSGDWKIVHEHLSTPSP